jgi:hypothetical protein
MPGEGLPQGEIDVKLSDHGDGFVIAVGYSRYTKAVYVSRDQAIRMIAQIYRLDPALMPRGVAS